MSEAAFAALASARQAAGLSIEEAARQLKFAPRQIEALEAGQLQRLPGGTFVRGMVRSYAKLLRVDAEPLLAQIAAQVPPPDDERLAHRYRQPVPFSDGARRSNYMYVALSLVLLVAVAAVALQWRQERASSRTLAFVSAAQMPAEPAKAPAAAAPAEAPAATPAARSSEPAKAAAPASVAKPPARPESAPKAEKPADAGPQASKPAATLAAAAKPAAPGAAMAHSGTGRISLQFEGESWVEIRSGSGKLLVASLHTPGTERLVSGVPPFEMVIGNAQQVRLTYNDKPVDLTPYVRVEVARFTLQ
ncbi:MAG TPA: helix-turn-helix domain-containing protein [Burkholderiales bacterium]